MQTENQNKSSTNILYVFYMMLFVCWAGSAVIKIPVPVNLIITSTCIIYIGCHRSLKLRDKGSKSNEDTETISKDDAYKFPLIGSAVLFGLYLLFKYFDKDIVNLLLSIYFSGLGAYTLAATLEPLATKIIGMVLSLILMLFGMMIKLGLTKPIGKLPTSFTIPQLVAGLLGTAFAAVYFKTKFWMMNNVFGISFCIQGMERISIGSYKIGAILLIGLFFYDIFWVFGTEVMVTVATKFDGPIKLLFPREVEEDSDKPKFSMLGLGDIVVPGIFIALMLRFDAERVTSEYIDMFTSFYKPYFNVTLISYIIGLGMTVFVMYYFNAAQPALLYLVPCCLISSAMLALVRGEFGLLASYSEEEDEAEAKDAKTEGEQEDPSSDNSKKVK